MNKISATELSRHPGVAVDLALREGKVIVTRYYQPVAVLSRDMPKDKLCHIVSMQVLLRSMTSVLDAVKRGAMFSLTRNGRPVAWLLPVSE